MLSRIKLAACLASAALIGPAVAPISAGADVSECAPITIGGQAAGCIAVSATPSQQANGDPQLDITATLQVYGQHPVTRTVTGAVPIAEVESDVPRPCDASGQWLFSEQQWGQVGREYGVGRVDTDPSCFGILGLTIVPSGNEQQASVTPPTVTSTPTTPLTLPYDIPQICITTTPGACAGPFTGEISPEVPVPGVTSPAVSQGDPTQLCLGVAGTGSNLPFSLGSQPVNGGDVWGYYDGSNCLPYVPLGLPSPNLT